MTLDIKLTRLHGPLQNYGLIIHDNVTGQTACVDAGEGAPIFEVLDENGWGLDQLWVTHHHNDHTAAIEEVKAKTGCTVYGPSESRVPIRDIDTYLKGGDTLSFAGRQVQVLHTPGHTLDMLNYHMADDKLLAPGDTLFVMGCGRLFEGAPEIMYDSLRVLAALPPETTVYCPHEYTVSNGEFAAAAFPDNQAIAERLAEVRAMRTRDEPTVVTTIGRELETNPFLLAADAPDFARLRAMKDAA